MFEFDWKINRIAPKVLYLSFILNNLQSKTLFNPKKKPFFDTYLHICIQRSNTWSKLLKHSKKCQVR